MILICISLIVSSIEKFFMSAGQLKCLSREVSVGGTSPNQLGLLFVVGYVKSLLMFGDQPLRCMASKHIFPLYMFTFVSLAS